MTTKPWSQNNILNNIYFLSLKKTLNIYSLIKQSSVNGLSMVKTEVKCWTSNTTSQPFNCTLHLSFIQRQHSGNNRATQISLWHHKWLLLSRGTTLSLYKTHQPEEDKTLPYPKWALSSALRSLQPLFTWSRRATANVLTMQYSSTGHVAEETTLLPVKNSKARFSLHYNSESNSIGRGEKGSQKHKN